VREPIPPLELILLSFYPKKSAVMCVIPALETSVSDLIPPDFGNILSPDQEVLKRDSIQNVMCLTAVLNIIGV